MVTVQASVAAQGVESVFHLHKLAKMAAKTLNNNFSEKGQLCLRLGKDEVNSRYLIFKRTEERMIFSIHQPGERKIWFIAL